MDIFLDYRNILFSRGSLVYCFAFWALIFSATFIFTLKGAGFSIAIFFVDGVGPSLQVAKLSSYCAFRSLKIITRSLIGSPCVNFRGLVKH